MLLASGGHLNGVGMMSETRPFPVGGHVNSGSLEPLRDWLAQQDATRIVAMEYTIGDLVSDLDEILGSMWSDGIDARGDDA